MSNQGRTFAGLLTGDAELGILCQCADRLARAKGEELQTIWQTVCSLVQAATVIELGFGPHQADEPWHPRIDGVEYQTNRERLTWWERRVAEILARNRNSTAQGRG